MAWRVYCIQQGRIEMRGMCLGHELERYERELAVETETPATPFPVSRALG